MTPEAHAAFTAALVSALATDPDVVGVVLLGSSSGRDARGERLSGHQFVRCHALRHLLVLLPARLSHDAAARLDSLDPHRRFELARPDLGRDLEAALCQPAPAAAKALLGIAVRELPELVSAPARAAAGRALAGDRRSAI